MTPLEQLNDALRSPNPAQALRSTVSALVAQGRSQSELYDLLERLLLDLRARTDGSEACEDLVLDFMDGVTGWCHPTAQVFPDTGSRQ
jgi:hypothetical protein